MEVVHITFARHKCILARVDNLLQVSLGLVIFPGEEISLSCESPCEALGHAYCTVNIGSALALFEVGCSFFALLGNP